ncbi:MAG: hypothetical protein J5476_06950 [Lachnospiraceae bacterium]|nr:hypothetical protein [Lachnospiraceae bacterium]
MKNIDKKFRVSKNKLMTSVLALFGGFIATGIIENSITDFDENLVPCMIIAVSVGLVCAALCIIFVKEYYMQIREDGFELVKGKKVTKYDFSDFAGSNVTRHYMNGIYTGTSREIQILEASGKTTKINANNLSKGSFAELVTYLGQTRFTKAHDIEATAEYFKEGIEFQIPNEKIVKANKKKVIGWTAFVVALAVLFIGMMIYSLITKYDSTTFFVIMIFAGLGALIELFMELIPAAVTYHKMKNMPARIRIDEYSLTIGDKTFSSSSILNIMLVPAEYTILTRDFIVITKNNEKIKYNFGKNDLKGKLTYASYDKLSSAIEVWCIVNKINFMQILG